MNHKKETGLGLAVNKGRGANQHFFFLYKEKRKPVQTFLSKRKLYQRNWEKKGLAKKQRSPAVSKREEGLKKLQKKRKGKAPILFFYI